MRCAARAQRLRRTGERQANRTMDAETRQSAGSYAPTAAAIMCRNVSCALGQPADHAWCVEARAHPSSAFVVQPTRAIALRFGAGIQRAGLAMESGTSDISRYDRQCDVTLSADPGELQWRAALVLSNANVCVQASTGGRALIRSTAVSASPCRLSRAARWSVRQRDLWSWSRRQQAMWHVPAAHVTVPGTATRMRRCRRPPQPQ
ncbi:UNVERIFIED_ORG: hypothetical protein GGR68_002903 [Xanthomonas campestris]